MKLIPDVFRRNPADRHYWKGVEYQKKGLYGEAREEYLKAIENDPGYHKAYTNIGSLAMKSSGTIGPDMTLKNMDARDYFLKALEIKPDNATALYNLGTISYMYTDNESEAFEYFARAINADLLYMKQVEQYLGWASYSPGKDFEKVVNLSISQKTK